MTQLLSSFNPFFIDDDDNNRRENGDSRAKRTNRKQYVSGSSRASNSISTTTSKLPPRLNVSLILHEEALSTAMLESNDDSGSFSQLDIKGKMVVSMLFKLAVQHFKSL